MYTFLKEYDKELEPITSKYKSDAAIYYRKRLHYTVKGLPLAEKAPPKNAAELAERTA